MVSCVYFVVGSVTRTIIMVILNLQFLLWVVQKSNKLIDNVIPLILKCENTYFPLIRLLVGWPMRFRLPFAFGGAHFLHFRHPDCFRAIKWHFMFAQVCKLATHQKQK